MEIRDLVSGQAIACGMEVTMSDAARLMLTENVGSVAVIDGGTLMGIVTERDVVRAAGNGMNLADVEVRDWMTGQPDVADPDLNVEDAARWMLTAGYRHLPVVDEGRLIGVASIKDVLWALDGFFSDDDE